jgi:hypothetical protein
MTPSPQRTGEGALSLRVLAGDRRFWLHLLLFTLLNAVLYGWIVLEHRRVQFHRVNYTANAYHHIADPRITDPGAFRLLTALDQWDAQWFTRIADEGYRPYRGELGTTTEGRTEAYSYAFFPLYPLLLRAVNALVGAVETSAFLVTQVLLLAGFASVYWLVARWYSADLAVRTAWLLFLHPFSIFYRSYFSEGLFLLLLVLALDALRLERLVRAGVTVGLLAATRLVGVAGGVALALQALPAWRSGRLAARKAVVALAAVAAPVAAYALLCWIQTGNPLFFMKVRSAWYWGHMPPFATLRTMLNFASIPWHGMHYSRVDVLSIVLSGVLLALARKWLPRSWWTFSLLLWLIPIFTTDTMSAARYQVVNLPLFVFAAEKLPSPWYELLLGGCAAALFAVSLYFVNWYWIG